jgi:hypothetical protein
MELLKVAYVIGTEIRSNLNHKRPAPSPLQVLKLDLLQIMIESKEKKYEISG